jgi:tetratricopeptide (TPR) repeat protein
MPTYLWTGKNAHGAETAEKINAPTAELARELLEKRGYTGLKMLKDDLMAEISSKNEIITKMSAAKEAELLRKGKITFGEYAWRVVRDLGFLGIAGAGLVVLFWGRHPYLAAFVALVIVTITVTFTRIRLHGYLFTKMIEAREWHRADETLRLLLRLEKVLKPEDVSLYRSLALIWKGNVASGIADWAQHQSRISPWRYSAHLSILYENAGDTDRAIELGEQAVAQNPNVGALYIDLAWKYLLHERNLLRAKELLDQADRLEQIELAKPFLLRNRGIVALREGQFAEAERLFLEALGILQAHKEMHFRYSNIMLTKAFLAQAAAKLGKVDQAKKDFAEAKKWLEAAKMTPVLKACGALGF